MQAAGELTQQLQLYSGGHRQVADAILRAVMPKLRQIAAWKLSDPRFSRSSTPTELIDETWVKRLHQGRWKIENREHFFSLVGLAMEQVLVDMARKRLAQRRGDGAVHLCIDDVSTSAQPRSADAEQILAIRLLIEELARLDPVNAAIVRAHYIAGYGLDEIAKERGLSLRQVRHRWEKSKLWLAERLVPRHPEVRKRSPGHE